MGIGGAGGIFNDERYSRLESAPGETRPGGLRNISYADALRLSLIVSARPLSCRHASRGSVHHAVQRRRVYFLEQHLSLYGWSVAPASPDRGCSFLHLVSPIGGNEFTQIIAARLLYVVVWLCSLALLYRLGRTGRSSVTSERIVLFPFSYSILRRPFRSMACAADPSGDRASSPRSDHPSCCGCRGAVGGCHSAHDQGRALGARLRWCSDRRTVGAQEMAAPRRHGCDCLRRDLCDHHARPCAPYRGKWRGDARCLGRQDWPGLSPTCSLGLGVFPRFPVLQLTLDPGFHHLGSDADWGPIWQRVNCATRSSRRNALVLLFLALPLLSVTFYANIFAYVLCRPRADRLPAGWQGLRAFFRCSYRDQAATAFASLQSLQSLWSIQHGRLGQITRPSKGKHSLSCMPCFPSLFPISMSADGGELSGVPHPLSPILALTPYKKAGIPVISQATSALSQTASSLMRSTHSVTRCLVDRQDFSQKIDPVIDVSCRRTRPRLRATYAPYIGKIYLAGDASMAQCHAAANDVAVHELSFSGATTRCLSAHPAHHRMESCHEPGVRPLTLDATRCARNPDHFDMKPDLRLLLWAK